MAITLREFTVELLEQTADKKILDQGPHAQGFWKSKRTSKIKLGKYSERLIVQNLYTHFRQYYKLGSNGYLRLYPYYYSDNGSRVSMWVWVLLPGKHLYCHVESVVLV